jgi:hypothetical protein
MSRRLFTVPTQQTAWIALALAITLIAAPVAPALAGQACDDSPPSADSVVRGLALAEQVRARLDASGAQVVVLARAGQDLSRHGLRWSHVGLAYRQPEDGRWRVAHKLNHCGTAEAAVYRQGLGEFFLDKPHRYEAAFAPLAPELQARLLPRLRDNEQVARLHQPRYSMVSYAWGLRYQQSNQWALEMLAADGGAGTRDAAQAWLQQRGYVPQVIQLDTFTRLGARVTMAHVAFDDHPGGERLAGRIATVTADSMFRWLRDEGLAGAVTVVR